MLQAFSEAAMVGGIADWFAVVALFRHPLGIPIWHTAIIPTKKNEIGENLGNFVSEEFLNREKLEIKLEELPAAITQSLKKAYPDAVITKAYKNEKSEYKLDVTVGDKVGNLFANADGTWIKK